MAIITISRDSYSKGKEVAEAVADELGYRCISREILIEASKQFNIPEMKLARALHDAPAILDRFMGLYATINAYTQLNVRFARSGQVYSFPPRWGEQLTPAASGASA